MGDRWKDMQQMATGQDSNLGRCVQDRAYMVLALPGEPPGSFLIFTPALPRPIQTAVQLWNRVMFVWSQL